MNNRNKFWNDQKTIKSFINQPISQYWLDIFSQIPKKETKKILDLGCGGGRNSEMLVKLGFDTYACDIHEGMVNATRNRLKAIDSKHTNNRVIKASMNKLPYQDGYFDFVLSHGVYHNATSLNEFKEALKETSRVLRSGGKLFFNLFSSNYLASDYIKVSDKDHLYMTKEKLHMVLLNKNEYLNIANQCGLKRVGEIIEYGTNISTGKRSVMRGVLIKEK